MKRALAALLVVCSIPGVARAAVAVSEVAWMGSADNANAEWVELCTDSSASLAGWSLVAADGQPTVALDGTLSGCGILERTSDDTVPGVAALTVYTGALGNSGEVLELRDAQGQVIDRVDGSNEWAIGGDNTEKLTLQRSGSFGAWLTAPPTPGRTNGTSDERPSGTSASSPTRSAAAEQGSASGDREVNLPPSPPPALRMELGGDRTAVAGVPVTFTATAYNESGREIALDTIIWTFGDGATGSGAQVRHTYPFPGEYAVLARGSRPLFRTPVKAEDRAVVRVVPCAIQVSGADLRSIELTNGSESDVELARFTLAAGKQHFRIPEGTVLLAGKAAQFPATVTGLRVADPRAVALFTPENMLVSQYGAPSEEVTGVVEVGAEYRVVPEEESPSHDQVDESATPPPAEPSSGLSLEHLLTTNTPSAPEGSATGSSTQERPTSSLVAAVGSSGGDGVLAWWLVGLAAAICLAGATVFLVRRERSEVIEGFTIEGDE